MPFLVFVEADWLKMYLFEDILDSRLLMLPGMFLMMLGGGCFLYGCSGIFLM